MPDNNYKNSVIIPNDLSRSAVAVLTSGGLLSSILTACLLEKFDAVYPIYIRLDSKVQDVEEHSLRRFLAAIRGPHLGRITVLNRSDNEQFLDNQTVLLSKAAVWCAINDIETLAICDLGSTDNNKLLESLGSAIETTVGKPVSIISPLSQLKKNNVMELGRDIPLEFTFSCEVPANTELPAGQHCGKCTKCVSRKESFAACGIVDKTIYARLDQVAKVAG